MIKEEASNTEIIEQDDKKEIIECEATKDILKQKTIAAAMLQSGCLPDFYKTSMQVVYAIALAKKLGLNPEAALQNFYIIKGKFCLYGEAPMAIVQNSGLLESKNEYYFDEAYKIINFENKNLHVPPFGAYCTIKRKDMTSQDYYFTIDDAKRAGVYKKAGPWTQYTNIMLKRRARSFALKLEFADLFLGIGIAEYDHNQAPDLNSKEENKKNIYIDDSAENELRDLI